MTSTSLFPGFSRDRLGQELLAGVTLLAISVPLNIGYAQIAGLPPSTGLYALVLPTLVFMFTTSSRQVLAAPDAAAAALVASSLAGLGVAGDGGYVAMAAAQAIIGGFIFLLASVFRLGFLANFLSKPILVGFVGGLALEIMLSQVAKMLGVHLEGEGFLVEAVDLVTSVGEANGSAVALSIGALAILLVGRRIAPHLPWALVVLVAATIATVSWSLADRGVAVLGEVPAGFPGLSLPSLDLSMWLSLVPSALALTMITVAEGLLVIRSYAEKHDYPTEPNRDLAAFGLANIAAGISGSFTVGSSTSRTAAMDQAGSRSQVPSIVLVVGSLLLILFGTGLLEDVPSPAIGAIVAVAVYRLVGIGELRQLWNLSRFESVVALSCMAGVLVLGPIRGVLLAFVLSLVNLARRAANPAVDVLAGHDDPEISLLSGADNDETAHGIIVMRFAAPIFFANGATLSAEIRRTVTQAPHDVRVFVLDLEAATDIDVTGAEALGQSLKWLQGRGVTVAFSRVRPDMRARLVQLGMLEGSLEFATNREALAATRTPPPTP